MTRIPGFQYPDADFQGFSESSVQFRLEFFVSDFSSDHFERRGDVISDIGVWIKQEFDEARITLPFPHLDVNLTQVKNDD